VTRDSGSQVYTSGQSIRERVGLIVDGSNAEVAVKTIVAAEDAGVRQIWMSQPPVWPDVLTTFAAAATKTSTVRFGTSINEQIIGNTASLYKILPLEETGL
jgi:alkanesulfonate monooxygenase SsuD/methylene tetrahydromethanopterin reductase-like flavin-dependent oxidoreductase (luciferase family)